MLEPGSKGTTQSAAAWFEDAFSVSRYLQSSDGGSAEGCEGPRLYSPSSPIMLQVSCPVQDTPVNPSNAISRRRISTTGIKWLKDTKQYGHWKIIAQCDCSVCSHWAGLFTALKLEKSQTVEQSHTPKTLGWKVIFRTHDPGGTGCALHVQICHLIYQNNVWKCENFKSIQLTQLSRVLIKMSRYSNNMTDTPLKIQGESISEFEYINNCFKGLSK